MSIGPEFFAVHRLTKADSEASPIRSLASECLALLDDPSNFGSHDDVN
eukprot:CAMPEP_0172401244 /NCGR_PEP_ID=MMETSP1061-20121228/49319_1 /TAXON_ID=37318 /ORGANISM="Pseudo-nitzschia pungens, Strain cf. pungens" /LENGTH=47 /DNA_ID= /DNA_START= /DNA_END= /DNA_ORIENTATION=